MSSVSEKDTCFCPFFHKCGACAYGSLCSRMHIRPESSKTILLNHFYPNPNFFMDNLPPDTLEIDNGTIIQNFNDFYRDIFFELKKYGPIKDILVAANLEPHLEGNTLVMYEDEESAVTAMRNLRGRYYAGRIIDAQFSPVTNFEESICKQFKEDRCNQGLKCNYIHPKRPSDEVLIECGIDPSSRIESKSIDNHTRNKFNRNDEQKRNNHPRRFISSIHDKHDMKDFKARDDIWQHKNEIKHDKRFERDRNAMTDEHKNHRYRIHRDATIDSRDDDLYDEPSRYDNRNDYYQRDDKYVQYYARNSSRGNYSTRNDFAYEKDMRYEDSDGHRQRDDYIHNGYIRSMNRGDYNYSSDFRDTDRNPFERSHRDSYRFRSVEHEERHKITDETMYHDKNHESHTRGYERNMHFAEDIRYDNRSRSFDSNVRENRSNYSSKAEMDANIRQDFRNVRNFNRSSSGQRYGGRYTTGHPS